MGSRSLCPKCGGPKTFYAKGCVGCVGKCPPSRRVGHKIDIEKLKQMYATGSGFRVIAEAMGVSTSTIRVAAIASGVPVRSSRDGFIAAKKTTRKGVLRGPMPEATKAKLSEARRRIAEATAKGVRVNTNGYLEFTRGPHKGRHVHVVLLEASIGRRIAAGEQVHHVDRNKFNNDLANLVLLSSSEHARVHRLSDCDSRRRSSDGRFA